MTDLLDEIERTTWAWESWDAKPGLASTAGAFEDAAQALARSAGIETSVLRGLCAPGHGERPRPQHPSRYARDACRHHPPGDREADDPWPLTAGR